MTNTNDPNNPSDQSTAPCPLAVEPLRWRSLDELPHLFGRSYRTVALWVVNGTLAEAGIVTYQDSKRRWWVLVPDELHDQPE